MNIQFLWDLIKQGKMKLDRNHLPQPQEKDKSVDDSLNCVSNEELTFQDIFKYKSVSFKISGAKYDIMKKEDVEKMPCLPFKANIFGKEYSMDYILKENANYIYKHGGDVILADICLQKAEEINPTLSHSISHAEKVTASPSDFKISESKKKYAITLMLWGHDRAFEYNPDRQYPTYYAYECGLTNPNLLQKQLFDEGFYREATFNEIFETYTIKELSIIADSIGISKYGKKTELVKRILANSTPLELHTHVGNKKYYSLSEKGKYYLAQHYDYVLFHRYSIYNISLEEYERTKNKISCSDCATILIYILKQRISQNNFDELSHVHLKQLYDNTNQLDMAMREFLTSLYFRVNCFFKFSFYYKTLEYYTADEAKQSVLNVAHPDNYLSVEDATYFSKNFLYYKPEIVDLIYEKYKLDFIIINKTIFAEILNEMENQPFFDTEKWNDFIYDKYILAINNM